MKTESAPTISVEAAAADSQGFVDRVYYAAARRRLRLEDLGMGPGPKGGAYEVHQSASFPDTVVFQPWETGKLGPAHPDFDDDGFNFMLCVEAAVAREPAEVAPLESWSGFQEITVTSLELSE